LGYRTIGESAGFGSPGAAFRERKPGGFRSGELEIRGRVKEIKGRKVIVETTAYAEEVATARGEVVAIPMTENFLRG
jgi:hypothetical protein